ncbi:FAD-dependent oxidoreductase [Sulfitobacter sp. F26204]|uniref:NAD(P)/FAD-dependent oxidoreductase n=1 Tax=Sulfitobacter sp. F26204 TaxID=2996014 RepID=UPI00225DED91|nr:FAD-dependent oxidoreductase [Sulfitobacter sp. F26204]MCX7561286.1 FAD-dependent oxidoreductase [Sulfitobacter sp. F26204]
MKRIDASMHGVQWVQTSKESFQNTPYSGAGDFDLVVVGGGFCGLSIARFAARENLSVLLLEAGKVGCGASGRNAGIAVPHFPGGMTVEDVDAQIGKPRSRKFTDLVAGGTEWLFEEIREHQILCDAEQNGWIQPAHSQKSLRRIERVYESWKANGVEVQWLAGDEISERTGAKGYIGGWYGRTGGAVNPYALGQGLARVALAQGVVLMEQTPVTKMHKDGGVQIVETPAGSFRAKQVVFATNGYTPGLFPHMKQSVIPIRLFQTFTRPLTPEEQAAVMPMRQTFTDLRKGGGFIRLDVDNRILTGGAVFNIPGKRSYGVRHSNRFIEEIFPSLKGIETTQYWEGYCALTESSVPAIERLDDNVFAVLGFSSRGLVLTNTLGREMAHFLAGKKPEAELPLPIGPAHPVPFQAIKTFLGEYAFPVLQARDRLRLS